MPQRTEFSAVGFRSAPVGFAVGRRHSRCCDRRKHTGPVPQSAGNPPAEGLCPGPAAPKGYWAAEWGAGANKFGLPIMGRAAARGSIRH